MDKRRLESCIAEIDRLTDMLSEITDNIVEYDSPEAHISKKKFDFSAFVSMIIISSNLQYQKKNLQLTTEGEKGIDVMSGKSLISQALCNLLSNASKFTPEGGKVKAGFRTDGVMTIKRVCDSGPSFQKGRGTRLPSLYAWEDGKCRTG